MMNNNIQAYAKIKGSSDYPDIYGTVTFSQRRNGILVSAQIHNLPFKACEKEIYGFHIHEGMSCTGNDTDPFADAKTHYNSGDCSLHPYHTGDMPPLFGNNGFAYMSYFTNKFSISEIIGKAIIIHDSVDDFTTQPSGNSGQKIACGIIQVYN